MDLVLTSDEYENVAVVVRLCQVNGDGTRDTRGQVVVARLVEIGDLDRIVASLDRNDGRRQRCILFFLSSHR